MCTHNTHPHWPMPFDHGIIAVIQKKTVKDLVEAQVSRAMFIIGPCLPETLFRKRLFL